MIDLEARAQRAVESPVGAPPERARLEALARRIRRRRTVARATVASAIVVVVGGVIALASHEERDVRVITTGPTSTTTSAPSAPVTTGLAPDLNLSHFIGRLSVAHHVVRDGTAFGIPMGATGHLLCVDGTPLHVYEYNDRAARIRVSDSIGADGSRVGNSTVDWVGPPHFFADGRIIVLLLTNDAPLQRWLTGALGPTLSPQARGGKGADVCSTRP